MKGRNEILVIGVGNADRGDDAAGRVVARVLRDQASKGVRVCEHSGEGAALIDTWQGAEAVIVVDAVSSGSPPGTIHRFDVHAGALPSAYFSGSTHAINLADAIELARVMGQLPPTLRVFGIEGNNFQLGKDLSPAVAKAALEVIHEIDEQIALSIEEAHHA